MLCWTQSLYKLSGVCQSTKLSSQVLVINPDVCARIMMIFDGKIWILLTAKDYLPLCNATFITTLSLDL
jgi:hypothetical protein